MNSVQLTMMQPAYPPEVTMTRNEMIASQGNAELSPLFLLIALVIQAVVEIFVCLAAAVCCCGLIFVCADAGATDGGFLTARFWQEA